MEDRFKLIIAGGRDFNDYELLVKEVENFMVLNKVTHFEDLEIVSGMARGADSLGVKYSESHQPIKLTKFPANWDKYGKSAGYIRNKEMANYADALIAFWDGKSRGTQHMINLASQKGLKIKIVRYE